MSLLKLTREALGRLSTPASQPQTLDVAEARRRIVCELSFLDTVGCSFQLLRLETDELADASTDRLKQLSEDLSARLTYLLEPLRPIETDAEGCTVQMRSLPPRRDEDGTHYYELLVRKGGHLSLCRYAHRPGQTRQVAPANVTREVLLRLVEDFEAVLGKP